MDRLTYLGISELFLPVQEVSLKSELSQSIGDNASKVDRDAVLGALLERQVESLDSSKWKPAVHNAMGKLLQDALEVYTRQNMPVRRARVMLKCLELASATNGKGARLVDDPEELVLEADTILRSKARSFHD